MRVSISVTVHRRVPGIDQPGGETEKVFAFRVRARKCKCKKLLDELS